MRGEEAFDELLDELIGAIEERECADPDGRDWGVEARIRRLECQLLDRYRVRPRALVEVGPGRPMATVGADRGAR